jgi:hypothetical protein
VRRMAGCELADQDEATTRGLDLLTLAIQLDRVCLAINSAVVPEPDERRRAVAPEVTEPYVVPILVR